MKRAAVGNKKGCRAEKRGVGRKRGVVEEKKC